jgi:DNA mismatch endonuclease (patch repair protein)
MTRELPTDPVRSALMKRVRRHGTHVEDLVASALRAHHIFYRRNVRSLPGSPDFANKSKCWVIFVNGCYWHHHKNCARGTIPTRNRAFWVEKFSANRHRDAKKIRALRNLGFHVVVIWECEGLDKVLLESKIELFAKRTPNRRTTRAADCSAISSASDDSSSECGQGGAGAGYRGFCG